MTNKQSWEDNWEEKLKPKVSITDHSGKYSEVQNIAQMLLNDYWEELKPKIRQLLTSKSEQIEREIREGVITQIQKMADNVPPNLLLNEIVSKLNIKEILKK